MKNEKNETFFFILCPGRSGSTLLQQLLDAHPNIQIPPESRFIIYAYYKFRNITIWTDEIKRDFISALLKDKKIALYWNLSEAKILFKNRILHFIKMVLQPIQDSHKMTWSQFLFNKRLVCNQLSYPGLGSFVAL